MKVPSAVPVFFLCLIVGVVFGAVLVSLLNVYNPYLFEEPVEPGMQGKKGGGNGKGKGKGEGFAKMQPQVAPGKRQLIQLVAKLDQLMSQPPNLELSDKQKAELVEKLKDVDELDKLSDVQASAHVAGVVQLFSREQREVLEKTGYVIPGSKQGGFGGGPKSGGDTSAHRLHVKSLQAKLAPNKAS